MIQGSYIFLILGHNIFFIHSHLFANGLKLLICKNRLYFCIDKKKILIISFLKSIYLFFVQS